MFLKSDNPNLQYQQKSSDDYDMVSIYLSNPFIQVLSKHAGLWITTSKDVFYSQATHITFICPMRFDAFPLDTQVSRSNYVCFKRGNSIYKTFTLKHLWNEFGFIITFICFKYLRMWICVYQNKNKRRWLCLYCVVKISRCSVHNKPFREDRENLPLSLWENAYCIYSVLVHLTKPNVLHAKSMMCCSSSPTVHVQFSS